MKKVRTKRVSVDVSFTFEKGNFHVRKGSGLASCSLWADIAPDPFSPDDYVFVGVYLESHFDDEMTKLIGKQEREAVKILEADKHWKDWAERELREMTGETVSGYEPLRASDVVDCGGRL